MTELAIEIDLAKIREARSIALLARDEVENGLGWRYRPVAIRGLIQDPDSLVLVARDMESFGNNDAILGFAVMTYRKDDAHLILLTVVPEHRRLGIGQRLLKWLEKTALYAGVQTISLEVREDNTPALSFYESAGYQRIKLEQNYYRGPDGRTEHAWVMRRKLVEIVGP